MSYNPVRANNFYKRNRGNRVLNPHAGTKHSDIMRRQGLGITVPMADRTQTATGVASTLMETSGFVVRAEVIAAGNNCGLGVHKTKDRMLLCRTGSLFVRVAVDEGTQGSNEYHRLQAGAHVRLPRGTVYSIASSGTEDAEVLFVEDPDYMTGFIYLENPETVGMSDQSTLSAAAPDMILQPRRTDQSIAKAQALQQAKETAVRMRRRPARASVTPGTQMASGATAVGKNATVNANSGNVTGVNPMPAGPGAYQDND